MSRASLRRWFKKNLVVIGISMSCLGLAKGVQSITFVPPEDGVPEDASSASSRSGEICPNVDMNQLQQPTIIPLLPESRYGKTLVAHPSILVYVPRTGAHQALFSIKAPDGRTHYQTTITLPDTPDILMLELPEEAPPLEIGNVYDWYLSLQCEGSWSPWNPISGKIERVEATSSLPGNDVDQALEAASVYAASGIWYDTVAIMFNLQMAPSPDDDLSHEWAELLQSVGLTDLIEASAETSP